MVWQAGALGSVPFCLTSILLLFSVKVEICMLKIEKQHLRSIRLIAFSNLMTGLLNKDSECFSSHFTFTCKVCSG